MAFLVAVAAVALVMNSVGAATTHQVGDTLGWTIPPPGAYVTWASNKTFTVGDVLVFTFGTGTHDVAEVTKTAYDSCSATKPISLLVTGPANLRLNTSGEHYYICTFDSHCSAGQKLSINVTGTSSPAPAPAPSTGSPPPSPSPSPSAAVPAPAPSTSSPPSPPASAPVPAPSTSSPPSPPSSAPAPAPSTSSPPSPPGAAPTPPPSSSPPPPGAAPTSPSSSPSPPGAAPTPPSSSPPSPPGSAPTPPPSAATSLRVAGLSAAFLSIALALLF